ncbi:SRPBCC family protein [Streptomyces sp. DSM 42041]|uniref:SRPBCC family protein n=1 Tax=Streptomyces hazeniae TaxID=3075538 RepID=A0ABU2P1F5_9ACTN|nr:SRPBCC family protein [Streptomyces sp. DSM 42041]MDT0382686.1 SRPBCC family protein [Streptomyces sp. DSM 42041]
MGRYEHSTTVRTDPQALFDYVAQVGNLPAYMDAMTAADPAGEGRVFVSAEVEGQRREGEAWFEVDRDRRSMRWGSPGPNDYSGELSVTDAGPESAGLRVVLNTERADGPGIRAGLETTLANVKRLIEGSGTETT